MLNQSCITRINPLGRDLLSYFFVVGFDLLIFYLECLYKCSCEILLSNMYSLIIVWWKETTTYLCVYTHVYIVLNKIREYKHQDIYIG